MNEDDLMKIAETMQGKLSKEDAASIADDIGSLITMNSETLKTIKAKDEQIAMLKSKNDKLVSANGALLQQVSMGDDTPTRKTENKQPEEPKKITWKDCFDSRGNFIK